MPNSSKRSSRSDEDDALLDLDDDEDSTARFGTDIRSGKGKEPDYNSSSTIQRVRGLTERNRKVIDKLTSITSDSNKRASLSSTSVVSTSTSSTRSRSPVQPTFSSSSSSVATSSSRISVNRASVPPGGSGSETERERPSSRDNRPQTPEGEDPTPPATGRRRSPFPERNGSRPRLRSAPSSPAKPPQALTPNSPRKHPSTSFAVLGSGRRTRTVSILQPDEEGDQQQEPLQTTTNAGRRTRAPLPREFRDRRNLDGGVSQSIRDRARTSSPNVLIARGAASPASSGVGGTFATPLSPRGQRPARAATVRESSRRVQRWSSVDEGSLNDSPVIEEGDVSRRQWRQSGSAESPLGGKEGRSVAGEGLRAAGLTRRGTEDVFADGVPPRRTRLSGGLGSGLSINGGRDRDVEELRRGIARTGIGQQADNDREPRTPATGAGSRFGTARNLHSILSSAPTRATTSLASYGDEEATRTAPTLRQYRSSYILPERAASRGTPQHDRSHSSPFGRYSQNLHSASSEHARLMLESLSMFEAQLARIPSSSSAPDLSRVAHNVVQSANGLNTLLRAANANALESQIEAEVGDAPAQVDASEVWRQVGGEYRESLRVSDELVRTMTALLLGMGRLVREAVKERGTDSPEVSAGGESGRSSLDGGERERVVRPTRRSTEADGRRSAEMPPYRESRRSLEHDNPTKRAGDLTSRPSTSLSTTREQERERRDHGDEFTRERDRSSALDRLSIRRMFTPRLRDQNRASPISPETPGGDYPSPTPAPRNTLDRLGRDQREQQRNLLPLGVPPPLPSLPSESLLERRGSTRRRSKFSNTSTATVRGTSIFPSINTPNPTTALSPQTASANVEVSAFPNPTDVSLALCGLQERDGRKRSMSAASASAVSASMDSSSGSTNARPLRSSRVRMSLDEAAFESMSTEHLEGPQISMNGERRERRRTIDDTLS
ncbi:hypothetical protein BU17DRAFT_57977 [Hysterangium stoloniferum]|nr:hypothetical protein BU17DRAFT_57977 [Hysterangium stoloniferum]